jgi:hypothetical protein
MPISVGQPVYHDLNKTKKGTMLVSKGEYCGSTPSPKYPTSVNHNFFEVTGERRHVVLSGGQLKYMQTQGTLAEGKIYDVIFKGKKTLEKGTFAGKEASEFDVLEYSRKEVSELVAAGAELRNAPFESDVEDLVDARQMNGNETLGDLR